MVAVGATTLCLILLTSYPPAYGPAPSQEARMSTEWQVRRTVTPRDEGQRRWDAAYQCLLQWTMAQHAGAPPVPTLQEDGHADRHLRPGLDGPPTADPDD